MSTANLRSMYSSQYFHDNWRSLFDENPDETTKTYMQPSYLD